MSDESRIPSKEKSEFLKLLDNGIFDAGPGFHISEEELDAVGGWNKGATERMLRKTWDEFHDLVELGTAVTRLEEPRIAPRFAPSPPQREKKYP